MSHQPVSRLLDVVHVQVGQLRATNGRDSPITVRGIEALAVKLREAGELDEAVTLLDEVVRRRTLALGPDNIEVLKPKASHEAMLTNLHRYAEAEETLEGTVAGLQRTLGPNDDTTRSLSARLSVAIFLHSAEEDAESQLLALDVLDANTRLDVEDHTTERARELLAAIDGTANAD